jgi:hypothetical protein
MVQAENTIPVDAKPESGAGTETVELAAGVAVGGVAINFRAEHGQ